MLLAELFNFHHLPCQFPVCCRDLAVGVVRVNALALGADLCRPDGLRDVRREHFQLAAVGVAQQRTDLAGVVRAAVHHCQQNPVNTQLRIDLPPYLGDSLQELFQSFCRKILCLHGNENAVRCRKCVDREHPQRRHTVDEDVIIVTLYGVQILFKNLFARHGIHQRNLQTGQLDIRGHEVYPLRMMQNALFRGHWFVHELLSHDGCKRNGQLVRAGKSKAQRQRTLRVCVHQQDPLASLRQTDTEICARRCLAHAAFLVGNGDCMCHFEIHLRYFKNRRW